MKYLVGLAFLLVISTTSLFGLEIEGGTKFKQYKIIRLKAVGHEAKSALIWRYNKKVLDAGKSGDFLWLTGPPGTYVIECMAIRVTADGTTKVDEAEVSITIGDEAPGPGPGPTPTPPGPTPTPPGPAPVTERPIAGPGSKVIVILETKETYPAKQIAAMQSKTVHDYLNSKCIIGPDGKTREWRIWDKDVVTTNVTKVWQDAVKRANEKQKSLPWVSIATDNFAGSYEGPLPADTDKFMELLKKYLESAPKKVAARSAAAKR